MKELQKKILYCKSVTGLFSKTEEDAIVELYKRFIADEIDCKEAGQAFEITMDEKQWQKLKENSIHTPRLISIGAFVRLFDQV